MNILVIDGQGGGIGRQLVESIRRLCGNSVHIWAAGTNTAATQAMLKAGADEGATGENPILVLSQKADVLLGPIGLVLADSMLGEITPAMAVAVGRSPAQRILIPLARCGVEIAGLPAPALSDSIRGAAETVQKLLKEGMANG